MSEGQLNSLAASNSLGAGDSLWQACVDQLAQELPEQQFNTWIKPLSAQVSDDFSRVTLHVANRFKLDWVRAQYSARIAGVLEKLYGQPVQLELAITPRENAVKTYSAPAVGSGDRQRPGFADLQDPPEHRAHLRHPGRRYR
jgi:chromosomal replication initiator protein